MSANAPQATDSPKQTSQRLGLVAIPKSADPGRIAENIALFDFELTPDEVAAVSALDQGEADVADSDTFGH